MADWSHTSPAELVASHLNRCESTRRAYAADLLAFARWLKVDSPAEAVAQLVGGQRGQARRWMEDWKHACQAQGLSLATTRRRVNSLMGLLSLAHEFDVIPWALRMKLPAARAIRDTRGPGRDVIENMLEVAHRRYDAKGARDHAILCLLFFSALRASEVLSIDVAGTNLDIGNNTVVIKPKGQWDRTPIRIPLRTAEAVGRWLARRGSEPGPLFISLQPCRRQKRERLSYAGLYWTVVRIGRIAGVKVWPHALRHSAATIAEYLTGSVGLAMALTRHKDPRSFWAYRDERPDMLSASEILVHGRMVRGLPMPKERY